MAPISPTGRLFTDQLLRRSVLTHDAGRLLYIAAGSHSVLHGSLAAVLVAFCLAYVGIGVAMYRLGRPLLAVRWLLALAELLFVVRLATDGDRLYVVAGVILMIDLSLRSGLRAVLAMVPLVALPMAVATDVGRELFLFSVAPLPLGAALGLGVRATARSRDRDLDRVAEAELDAEVTAARLAGRNEVMVRTGAAADLIQRAGVLLELSSPTPVRRAVAAAKAAVAEDARRSATYLGDVLTGWQHRRHAGSAALHDTVAFDLPPPMAAVLLTVRQAQVVTAALEESACRGTLMVDVIGSNPDRPDLPRTLVVGDHSIEIPVDVEHRTRLRTPIAGIVALIGCWMVLPFAIGAAEPSAIGVGFGLATIAGARLLSEACRRNDRVLAWALPGLVLWAAGYSLIPTPVPLDSGSMPFPITGVFEMLVCATVMIIPVYERFRREIVLGVVGLSMLLAVRHAIGVAPWRDVAGETLPILVMFALMYGFGEILDQASRQRVEHDGRVRRSASEAAYREGRAHELANLERSLDDLRRSAAESRSRLRTDVAAEIDRRIHRAEQSLSLVAGA